MTVFVRMYHPLIAATTASPKRIPEQAVDDYLARGWLQFDPDAPPVDLLPYVTQAAGDSRYVRDTELDAQSAALVPAVQNSALTAAIRALLASDTSDSATTVGAALRAALVSAPESRAAQAAGRRLYAQYLGRLAEVGEPVTVGALSDFWITGPSMASGVLVNAWDRVAGHKHDALRVLACAPAQDGPATPRWDWLTAAPTVTYAPGTLTGPNIAVETQYDGSKLDILIRQGDPGGLFAACQVFVDGKLVYDMTPALAAAAASGVVAGDPIRIPLTFPTARPRLIKVDGGRTLVGFNIEPGKSLVYPPSGSKGPRVMVCSDSYGELGWPELVGRMVGWPDTWNASSGSTGYLTDGTRTSLVDRYTTDVIAPAPNIVVYALGYNDSAQTPSAVATAAATVWDAVAAALPDCEQIVVGPWWPSSPAPSPATALDQALAAAAAARGLRYISPIAGQWITGTGKSTAPAGNGNADTYIGPDGVHPTTAGVQYLARRIAGYLATPRLS